MQKDETYQQKRLRLKKEIVSRAISQGRGAQAIHKINTLYRNIQATRKGSDDDIVATWSAELTDGRLHVTIKDLESAGIDACSRSLRAFNIIEALSGSAFRLREACIVPGTTTLH